MNAHLIGILPTQENCKRTEIRTIHNVLYNGINDMKVIHQLIMDLLLSDELQSIAEAQSLKVKGRNNSLPRRLGMVLLVLGCIRK